MARLKISSAPGCCPRATAVERRSMTKPGRIASRIARLSATEQVGPSAEPADNVVAQKPHLEEWPDLIGSAVSELVASGIILNHPDRSWMAIWVIATFRFRRC